MKSRPAMTSGSLLARETYFPEETAEKVGNKPAEPTIPATTICASGSSAMLTNPSFPEKTLREKKAILGKMWFHFGRVIGEYAHLDKIDFSDESVIKIEKIENLLMREINTLRIGLDLPQDL